MDIPFLLTVYDTTFTQLVTVFATATSHRFTSIDGSWKLPLERLILGMFLRDSCCKDTLLIVLLKDIHDNITKQQYLPYAVNILKILSVYIENVLIMNTR